MKTYTGTVLWISQRDGNGIILFQDKTEVYFDSSVTKDFESIKRKDSVTFNRNEDIKHVNCAKNVVKAV